MNKNKKNRKGFTIVELVIVIAVIGILATVLVPTFSNIVGDANKSAAIQEAKNIYTEYVAEVAKNGEYKDDLVIKTSKGNYVVVTDGQLAKTPVEEVPSGTVTYIAKESGNIVTKCVGACVDAASDGKCDNCGNTVSAQS